MNVVITGASRGLGKAMAEKFASNGHNLYLTSVSELNLYKALEDLQLKYPDVIIKARPFDLSDKKKVLEMGAWLLDLNIPIDILINNAGQFVPGSVYNEEDGNLEKMIETNLYSAYYLTRSVVARMIERKNGYVFNICSVASIKAYANGGSYSISKYALAGFSRNLREELKPFGIRVSTVYPGATYTDSWAASGLPEKRFLEAGDIADIVFAASQLSPGACMEEILLRPVLGDI